MTEARGLFSALSARGPVAQELTDSAWLQALLDVEAGLARALAHARLVPLTAAQAITSEARAEHFSLEELAASVSGPGNPIPALVKALGARVSQDAAAAVHHGATSQDIVDSALMLLYARATSHLAAELAHCAAACARLARQHRSTLMLGRTLLQQATPISFGLKAAGYLHGLDQARARLAQLRRSQLQAQLGGAAGTLSVLGDRGVEVLISFARELGLSEPVLPWHTQRGPIVEWAGGLGLCAAALSKIARDVTLLAQSEVDEAQEPRPTSAPGRGGSSTMPHKQNPVASIAALSCTRRVPGLVATLLACAEQEHERAAGAWHAEWETATELLRLVGSAASWLREALEGLRVDDARMQQNLDAAHDFPLAERVANALIPRLGRQAAQREVKDAVLHAAQSGMRLGDYLRTQATGQALLARADLDDAALASLLDPRGYLGSAELFIDRALAAHEKLEHDL